MTFTRRQRLSILAVLLAATLAVTAFSQSEDEAAAVVQPNVRKSTPVAIETDDARAAPRPPGRLDLASIARDANETVLTDVFAPKSWYVAPPPPPPAPPQAPAAPPLPFKYVGQLGEIDGKLVIYLSRGDTVHVVGAGDVIDSQYRVDSITETQVTITYIPLTTQQVLPTPRK